LVSAQMVMYEEELKQLSSLCERLTHDANARAVLLIDKNGQFLTSFGDVQNIDTTALASLTAGNVAATSGLAKIIGEKEFPHVFNEGEKDNLHLSVIGQKVILVVLFDKRSSLGLVRLRVKKASEDLVRVLATMDAKAEKELKSSPIAEITDEDIDNLFSA
jgi:predicted regulator of Ras-like GTPase activity (Roadblock/LC7/MglB family)